MELSTREENGVRIVSINGHLESGGVSEFRDRFLEETELDQEILLDCKALEYLDSSGLASLVSLVLLIPTLEKLNPKFPGIYSTKPKKFLSPLT